METEKSEKMTVQKLAQSIPLTDVLDIAEDVAKYIPAAGGVLKIVIKIALYPLDSTSTRVYIRYII